MVVFEGELEHITKGFFDSPLMSPGRVVGRVLNLSYHYGKPIIPSDGIDLERCLRSAWVGTDGAAYPVVNRPPCPPMNTFDANGLIWTVDGLGEILQVRHVNSVEMLTARANRENLKEKFATFFDGVPFKGLVYEQAFGADNKRNEAELIAITTRLNINFVVCEEGRRTEGRKRCLSSLWRRFLRDFPWFN
jgi:hypothetical protein